MRSSFLTLSIAMAAALLAGCDMLGIEGAGVVAARREAEGKAIGGACRHAARSIEQCYASNRKADKAAIFAGWREMNDYMRENKLEPMPASEAAAGDSTEEDAGADAAPSSGGGAAKKTGAARATGADGGKSAVAARGAAAKSH